MNIINVMQREQLCSEHAAYCFLEAKRRGKKMSIKPTENEINEVLNACLEAEDDGRSIYPGMSYEQGVVMAINWMRGDGPHPIED
jgi:hypothetical protein